MSAQQDISKRRKSENLSKSQSISSSADSIKYNHSGTSSSLFQSLVSGYKSRTTPECKSIDAFLVFTMLTGIAQLLYCLITRGFPYNTFIGVFSASVGSFVFAGTKYHLLAFYLSNPINQFLYYF